MEHSQHQIGNGNNTDLPEWSTFADMLQGMEAMNLGDASQVDDGECPVCRESYDGTSVQPIRFSCCRKPICRACALTWFAPEDQSKSCPRCRSALYRSTAANRPADYPGLQPLPDLADFPLDEEDSHRRRLAIDSAPLSREGGFALQSTARRFAAQPFLAVEESSTGFFGYFDRLAPLVRGEDFAFLSESCPIEPEDAERAFTVLRWHLRRDWRPLSNPHGEWPLVDGLRLILLHPASAWAFEQITSFLEEIAEGHREMEIHLFEEEVLERLKGKMVDILGRPLAEADLPRGYWDLVQDMLRCAADAMYVGRLVRCSDDDGMDDEDEMLYEYDRRRDEDM